jgi:PAS domain-containing protein
MTDLVRRNVAALRETMRQLGLIVAEIDKDLRYVWIDNPHPDFTPEMAIGKRDDELIPEQDAAELMALKREILDTGQPAKRLLKFDRSDGTHFYLVDGHPIVDARGRIEGIVTLGFEITSNEVKVTP